MKFPDYLKKSIYSGFTFFLTILLLSIWYGALNGGLSLSDKVGTWSGLTATSWNRIIDGVLDLDTRTTTMKSGTSKAWVNFDGRAVSCPANICTIRWQYNIASITRYAAGAYHVTFATPLLNANYVVNWASRNENNNYGASSVRLFSYSPDGSSSYINTTPTVNGFDIWFLVEGYTNGTDGDYISINVLWN